MSLMVLIQRDVKRIKEQGINMESLINLVQREVNPLCLMGQGTRDEMHDRNHKLDKFDSVRSALFSASKCWAHEALA